MIYAYRISMGVATLVKMKDGNDIDQKPKQIGKKFASDKEAKDACLEHHQKACKMAYAANRDTPEIIFF